MAAGGGYSTAQDLLRFAQALEAGKLVSKTSLRLATTAPGLGFFASGEGPLRMYGHAGGAPGMNGDLKVYPELGVVVVALANIDPPAAERLTDYYVRRMPVETGSEVSTRGRTAGFSPDEFWAQVMDYARQFVPPNKASKAVGRIKRSVQSGAEIPFESAMTLERELQQQLFQSEDAKEGLGAYNQKRKPAFAGR